MFDPFVEFLQDEAGEYLRAVGWYDGDEFDVLYLRDDIDPTKARDRAVALHNQLSWEWSPPEEEALKDFGPLLSSVNLHRDVVILHFPTLKGVGVVTTLDVDIARNLHKFVQDCLKYLERFHDQ